MQGQEPTILIIYILERRSTKTLISDRYIQQYKVVVDDWIGNSDNRMGYYFSKESGHMDKIFANVGVEGQGWDVEQFVRQFDQGSDEYFEQKEEQLRQQIEMMADEFRGLILKWQ